MTGTLLLYGEVIILQYQKQPPKVFYKKGILKNFKKFTGKHLCQSLSLNKVTDLSPATLLNKTQMVFCEFSEIFQNTFLTGSSR